MCINFKNWSDYNERKEKENLYLKSTLKEMSLKPTKESKAEIRKVYTGGRWRDFDFYKLEDTEPIKKRKTPIIRELELTNDNICKSLYVINKSAKRSRDTKSENYFKGNYGIVNKSKTRQTGLYNLKEQVMKKMINENILKLQGFHRQFNQNLLYYSCNGYGFHTMGENNIKGAMYLGEITNVINAESSEKDIKFGEAVNLLERFLK